MKRILIVTVIFAGLISQAIAQTTTRGTLVNTSPNRVSVYARPNSDLSARLFRNVLITVSITDQGGGNPAVTLDSNFIPNLTWDALPMVVAGGRAYFTFNGNDNGVTTTTSWTANTNNKVATFLFSNSNGFATAQLNDETPSGGGNGQMFWYVEILQAIGSDVTDYTTKFYGTNPLPVNNDGSPSFVGAQPISILPVLFQEFNVSKLGNNDAALSWVTSLEQNVSHFVVERSANGNTGWTKLGQVTARGNSNSPSKYSYTDQRVYDGTAATKVVFYRIISVDLDGREKVFPVRSLRFSATGSKEIGIYPNPAKDGFNVTIPLINPNSNTKLRLNLVNRLGQTVHGREINSMAASNYYYDIKTPGVLSGEYMLQIIYDGELLDTKKVIVHR